MMEPARDWGRFNVEFSPILRIVNSGVKVELLSLFHRNPYLTDRATGIAHRIGEDRVGLVARSLSQLERAGLLQTRIGGVTMEKIYSYSPPAARKEKIDRFFETLEKQDLGKAFHAHLRQLEGQRRRFQRLTLIGVLVILLVASLSSALIVSRRIISQRRQNELARDMSFDGQGAYESFYPNGQIKSRTEYLVGVKNGKHTSWFSNGQKMAEGTYQNGLLEGKWTYWDGNGQKIYEIEYRGGNAVSQREF